MEQSIDIVITSYYRPDFTVKCLDYLEKHTTTPHRVIVVDNGSNLQTTDMLWDAKENGLIDILILLDKNYGLEPAKNYALNHVSSSLYVDTDNDIIVPPPDADGDWLSKLVTLIETDEKLVALAMPPQVFIGAIKEEMFKDQPEIVERHFVGASMRLMRTDAVRAVGGWRSDPKDMHEANRGEELYICGKLISKGYKVAYTRDIECYHFFGDDNWGYGEEVEHYHRPMNVIPTDKHYGTLEEWLKKY